MQTPERFNRCSYEIFHLLRKTYIGLDENGFTSLPFDHLCRLNSCRIDVADNNFRAVACKEQRCCSTDSSTAAGDQRNLT